MKILSKIYWAVATLVLASPIVFGALLLLKLTAVVGWSWLTVTSPLWGAILLLMLSIITPIIVVSFIDGCVWLKGEIRSTIKDIIGDRKNGNYGKR